MEVLDLSGIANYAAVMRDHLLSSGCTTFGITATTPQIVQIAEITRAIRAFKPGVRIILGGRHVTLTHTAAKKERARGFAGRAVEAWMALEAEFDTLVSGDGEKAIFEALPDNAPKLINANDLHSPLFVTREEFDASVYPARHLIDVPSYHYSIDGEPSKAENCPGTFSKRRWFRSLRNKRMRDEGGRMKVEFID